MCSFYICIWITVLVSYCCITNCHRLITFMGSQFCRSEVSAQRGWILCSGSAEIQLWARLRSFLEALGEESTSEHIQGFGRFRLCELVRLRPMFSLAVIWRLLSAPGAHFSPWGDHNTAVCLLSGRSHWLFPLWPPGKKCYAFKGISWWSQEIMQDHPA